MKCCVFLGDLRDKRLVQNKKTSHSLTGERLVKRIKLKTTLIAAEPKLCLSKQREDFVLEAWSIVRHQTWLLLLLLFQTFPRQRGRRACITEQEHSCISTWSRLCATTRTAPSTTTPTSMEGSLRSVTQKKRIFRSGFKICFLFLSRTIILTKKHKD